MKNKLTRNQLIAYRDWIWEHAEGSCQYCGDPLGYGYGGYEYHHDPYGTYKDDHLQGLYCTVCHKIRHELGNTAPEMRDEMREINEENWNAFQQIQE